MNDADADYVGQRVQIGTGFGGMKPIAQAGSIVINDGVLALFGTKGDLIASAPLSRCALKPAPLAKVSFVGAVYLDVGGVRYSVMVGHVKVATVFSLFKTRARMKEFVQAFERLKSEGETRPR